MRAHTHHAVPAFACELDRSSAPVNARLQRLCRQSFTELCVRNCSAVLVAPASAFDEALGEEVFNNNCAACHTGGGNTLMPERTLKKDAIEKYLEGGYNLSAIIYQVRLAHRDASTEVCL